MFYSFLGDHQCDSTCHPDSGLSATLLNPSLFQIKVYRAQPSPCFSLFYNEIFSDSLLSIVNQPRLLLFLVCLCLHSPCLIMSCFPPTPTPPADLQGPNWKPHRLVHWLGSFPPETNVLSKLSRLLQHNGFIVCILSMLALCLWLCFIHIWRVHDI